MTATLSLPDYPAFLTALKARILQARTTAARAVNHELVLLYWDIGRGIVEKQQTAGWGDAVVERLAADLREAFPDMRGFSVANLWRMKQFYLAHTSPEFLAQAVRELELQVPGPKKLPQPVRESGSASITTPETEILAQAVREFIAAIPWGHHVFMLGILADPAARLYYLRATAQLGWSRSVLLNQIKAGAYERAAKEKKTHNFALALPEHFAEQADEMLKSSYHLASPNPIGVAEYQLQARLPAEFKGRLPSAKQLADAVREVLPPKK